MILLFDSLAEQSRLMVRDLMAIKTALFNLFRSLLTSEFMDKRLADWLGDHPNSRFVRRLVPGPSLYRTGSRRQVRRFDIEFDLDISDYQDWSLYFYNENDSSRGLLEFLKSGDFVCDVGGNIGQTALWIAHAVGPDGLVVSFEPVPTNIKRFERNMALNSSICNLRLIRSGLGSGVGKVVIKENAKNSGASRVTIESNLGGVFTDVAITTLDSFFSKNYSSQSLDFIKIDVEGFEMSVLRGAQRTLERYRPTLFVEVDDENLREQGSSSEELIEYLRSFGYSISDLTTGADLSVNGSASSHTDIICQYDKAKA